MKTKNNTGMEITTFEEHLEKQYGKKGTPTREQFEAEAMAFRLGELLKEARIEAKLTQGELAEKTGTKKSYISRIENGKGNIQLSTLIRIFEIGLNKRIGLTFL